MEKVKSKKVAVENEWEALRRVNEGLESLIPENETARKSESASSHEQPSALQSKSNNADSFDSTEESEKTGDLPGKPYLTESDKQLLFFIQKYKRAERICEEAGIKLRNLQDRYSYLIHKLKRYIEIEGLYRETSPVMLTDKGIQVSRDHLIESGFEVGDRFRVDFKENIFC